MMTLSRSMTVAVLLFAMLTVHSDLVSAEDPSRLLKRLEPTLELMPVEMICTDRKFVSDLPISVSFRVSDERNKEFLVRIEKGVAERGCKTSENDKEKLKQAINNADREFFGDLNAYLFYRRVVQPMRPAIGDAAASSEMAPLVWRYACLRNAVSIRSAVDDAPLEERIMPTIANLVSQEALVRRLWKRWSSREKALIQSIRLTINESLIKCAAARDAAELALEHSRMAENSLKYVDAVLRLARGR